MVRAILTLLLLTSTTTATAEPRYAGRPLTDALRDLQAKGLRIIYSEDVVTAEMIVRTEPRATEPRRVLDEILREHQLVVKPGPRESLLVVRASPAREEPTEEESMTTQMPIALAEIVVTPSQYDVLGSEPEQRQFLSREEVRNVPHFADDFHRAIRRIPGAASDDITARFNIRGGEEDEVVVLLDGAEIYDPFHAKDLIRAFSQIDVETVGAVDILTGGFPAQYGGRMSGVIDIATLSPSETRTEVGVSLLNLRALSQGVAMDGRAQWMVSVRRGYLRELLELINADNTIDPRYYDVLGKVQFVLSDKNVLSAHVLASHDTLRLDEDQGNNATATYDERYLWLNLRSSPTSQLFTQNVVTYGEFKRRRGGDLFEGDDRGSVDDRRHHQFAALRNDSTLQLTARNLLKGGVSAKRFSGRFDYDASAMSGTDIFAGNGQPRQIVRSAHLDASSTELSAYLSDRFRLTERIVVEGGARWENASHTPDGSLFSPRINAVWMISPRTSLRAAWGLFHQPQLVHELQVEDGVTTFWPAQRAEHRVMGIDHAFSNHLTLRLEAYDKEISTPRPRFFNLYNRITLFPEIRFDRAGIAPDRARARGLELLLRTDPQKALSGWMSYTHASVEDHFDERDVPRTWDQRQAVTFSVNYRRGERWNFNLAGTWHTGWPTTPLLAAAPDGDLKIGIGPINSERLPSYRRVDLRVSRHVPYSSGSFGFFVDLFNVLGTSNPTRVGAFFIAEQPDGSFVTRAEHQSVVGLVPSFGFSWQF